MATAAQITANRDNSALSTGPRTAEGKARSSANATQHGLTGRNLILPGERREDFDRLLAGLRESCHPGSEPENQIVDQMAEAIWRLERFYRIEHNLLEMGCEQHTANGVDHDRALVLTFLDYGKQLEKLQRYAGALLRQRDKLQRELDRMQYERLSFERARAEAEARATATAQKASTAVPAQQFGFVSQTAAQPVTSLPQPAQANSAPQSPRSINLRNAS